MAGCINVGDGSVIMLFCKGFFPSRVQETLAVMTVENYFLFFRDSNSGAVHGAPVGNRCTKDTADFDWASSIYLF